MSRLTIGKVAQESNVGVETIRYYERSGLIVQPRKLGDGFREYPRDIVHRIRFIKRAQELGFSLKEIDELLSLRGKGKGTCSTVKGKTAAKIQQIDEKIADLKRIQKALFKVRDCCEKQLPDVKCPVLEDFYA